MASCLRWALVIVVVVVFCLVMFGLWSRRNVCAALGEGFVRSLARRVARRVEDGDGDWHEV